MKCPPVGKFGEYAKLRPVWHLPTFIYTGKLNATLKEKPRIVNGFVPGLQGYRMIIWEPSIGGFLPFFRV